MGSDTSRFIIFIVFSSLLSSIVCGDGGGSGGYDPKALDALFRYYSNQTLNDHRRTGILRRVSLPSNFSGMKVSVNRLRSGSLWGRGVDSKHVKISPSVRTLPYVKRLAIVYDNLGNWSSRYYQVPGYSFVSPVVGFQLYDNTDITTLTDRNLTLIVTGKPILIRFPYLETKEKNVKRLKCVGFGKNGSFLLKNMTKRDVCVTEKAGHFCVVIRTMSKLEKKGGIRVWKWWVIGFAIGVVGLAVLVPVGVVTSKLWRERKIKDMEKESDSSVALDTSWVRGNHKMPCASMIRTQPGIEHDYVP